MSATSPVPYTEGSYQLFSVSPNFPTLWESFHKIRKAELFTARGKGDMYRKDHPDDQRVGHYPFLFRYNCFELGVVRLDHVQSPIIATAAIRLLAITKDQQRKGHGREMMNYLEVMAKMQDIRLLVVNAATNSTVFYRKLGFIPCMWGDPSIGYGEECVQMAKLLDHGIV